MATYLLVLLILTNFALLTKGFIKVSVGMALTAIGALLLAGPIEASEALHNGFAEFSNIAILFTAIAVPSHVLARSDALDQIGMWIGEKIGRLSRRSQRTDHVFLVVAVSMIITYVMAGLFHNTTSILISASIIIVLCKSYKLPGIPVLSGALIASNLGGFSTRWGDTPNIVEAKQWGLTHMDFFREITLINVGILIVLIFFTYLVTKFYTNRDKHSGISKSKLAYSMVQFKLRRRNTVINKRLMWVGLIGIVTAVIGPLLFPPYEITFALGAIAFCVLADYKEHRQHTLFALGGETYATLISIFVLSQVMAHSSIGIGPQIQEFLLSNNMSIWSIAISSYFGTLFTEAASWAIVASPLIHEINQNHEAAWALGGGISAGSSSILTAATAGVILLNETAGEEDAFRMTFGKYVLFGLSFSSLMLIMYIGVLTFF